MMCGWVRDKPCNSSLSKAMLICELDSIGVLIKIVYTEIDTIE